MTYNQHKLVLLLIVCVVLGRPNKAGLNIRPYLRPSTKGFPISTKFGR